MGMSAYVSSCAILCSAWDASKCLCVVITGSANIDFEYETVVFHGRLFGRLFILCCVCLLGAPETRHHLECILKGFDPCVSKLDAA